MSQTSVDAFAKMDSMYRYQRYFYDASRKFYLLGRDRLIDQIEIGDGDNIAEIGCGTGRNLEILARKHPNANFYGLDASSEMLESASAKTADLINVTLKTALADDYDHRSTFGLEQKFDSVFFSYSISMIPPWRESIGVALANLKPGGTLYIVDFYDQTDLPRWFRIVLKSWLRQFHVQFWGELIPFLYELDRSGAGRLEIESIGRRYAFIATFRKSRKS